MLVCGLSRRITGDHLHIGSQRRGSVVRAAAGYSGGLDSGGGGEGVGRGPQRAGCL